ncbi:hypothetical protein B2J93_4835 [Marssonina coronariae]|uniref:CMP/dCMP-type deaminase domain-containing protein n=1 Tax=Diplocarpon coronariae TaxID=2795749 RepID=A0A218Z8N6_9HELO|nr:hypothetical protein B2J93_4835 [Marssonina coronariae]
MSPGLSESQVGIMRGVNNGSPNDDEAASPRILRAATSETGGEERRKEKATGVDDGMTKKGIFVPLRTTLETRERERLGKVYITGVPAKLASGVLNLVRKLVPDDGGLDLQHLRRVAKLPDLPSQVQARLAARSAMPTSSTATVPQDLFLIAGPATAITFSELLVPLRSILGEAELFEADVPLLAPTSQEQASDWSSKYWPTVYKKSNPFGPHVSILSRAEEEMGGEVGGYMELAEGVARDADAEGCGERVGVVVVERSGGRGRVRAVAGDARWKGWRRGDGCGNVTAHAVMRAIGMVAGGLKARGDWEAAARKHEALVAGETPMYDATIEPGGFAATVSTAEAGLANAAPGRKQKILDRCPAGGNRGPHLGVDPELPTRPEAQIDRTNDPYEGPDEIFNDAPLLSLEKQHYEASGNENGYLCHELEIYCTHEPCVMCSMAIVHSRFGRVVFQRRMHETGGLCADGELGHGLFWRKELNWTLLAWQWESDDGEERDVEPCLHV